MSLDGLSSSNLAIYRPVDPAEVNHQTEKSSKQQAQEIIKKVEESAQDQKIDPDARREKNKQKQAGQNGQDEDSAFDLDGELIETIQKEENPIYNVKFNLQKNLVEMIEIESGAVIESIQPEDLINVMSKLKESSGILVDKKI